LTPDSGVIDACGSPRALPTPAIVRRNCVALKSSAASTKGDLVVAEPTQDRLADHRFNLFLAGAEERLPK